MVVLWENVRHVRFALWRPRMFVQRFVAAAEIFQRGSKCCSSQGTHIAVVIAASMAKNTPTSFCGCSFLLYDLAVFPNHSIGIGNYQGYCCSGRIYSLFWTFRGAFTLKPFFLSGPVVEAARCSWGLSKQRVHSSCLKGGSLSRTLPAWLLRLHSSGHIVDIL